MKKPLRLHREQRTMEAMVRLYCEGVHERRSHNCGDCNELLDYARQRLEKCPFQEEKPPCADCPIHCYQPRRREQVKEVMRYAGPRMAMKHPWFALRHWLDGFKKAPEWKKKRGATGT
jgi:hypothetical protein